MVVRYINGLKEAIQDKLKMNVIWSLSQAINYTCKVEPQLNHLAKQSTSH